ncbi:Hypothetical predicted protein [Octopus vulgaris]|uniref:Uncharacterized protein n=1 Tax=Octopus vulgaris TaxID=6645 RepID=A0AA36F9C1_OCTVU|nr:Hypothetical predicted protein [Octopus vulgaris]
MATLMPTNSFKKVVAGNPHSVTSFIKEQKLENNNYNSYDNLFNNTSNNDTSSNDKTDNSDSDRNSNGINRNKDISIRDGKTSSMGKKSFTGIKQTRAKS